MKIGVPKEIQNGESRVALVPQLVSSLKKEQHDVLVERGAGVSASFSDEDYQEAGATIVEKAAALYRIADIVLKVRPPLPQEARVFRCGNESSDRWTPDAIDTAQDES